MSWLVLGPHVILATESFFWELHLRVLDMLCAGRGEGERRRGGGTSPDFSLQSCYTDGFERANR